MNPPRTERELLDMYRDLAAEEAGEEYPLDPDYGVRTTPYIPRHSGG